MTENIHEIASHPDFGLGSRFDVITNYSPNEESTYKNLANIAYDTALELRRMSVDYDSTLRIVLSEFPEIDISSEDCWKLSENAEGGAPIYDIKSKAVNNSYKYYIGFVLTSDGQILEYEKAGDTENDNGLIHVVDRHRGVYIMRGSLSKRCYIDQNIMNSLDDLSYQAGLRTNI